MGWLMLGTCLQPAQVTFYSPGFSLASDLVIFTRVPLSPHIPVLLGRPWRWSWWFPSFSSLLMNKGHLVFPVFSYSSGLFSPVRHGVFSANPGMFQLPHAPPCWQSANSSWPYALLTWVCFSHRILHLCWRGGLSTSWPYALPSATNRVPRQVH